MPLSNAGNFATASNPANGSKSAQVITTVIPANGNTNLFQAGTDFYLIIATASIDIAPNNASFNTYTQGTGLQVDPSARFDFVQIRNRTSNSVIIQIFIGFGSYIDNRLIVANPLISNIEYPTYDANVSPLSDLFIPDLSGTSILDLNGNVWLALQRSALQIFNQDTGATILLKNSANSISVAAVFPETGITLPISGNYRIKPPSSTIPGIVSEVYIAIQPSSVVPT